jgi:hypothetical protein
MRTKGKYMVFFRYITYPPPCLNMQVFLLIHTSITMDTTRACPPPFEEMDRTFIETGTIILPITNWNIFTVAVLRSPIKPTHSMNENLWSN